MQIYSKHQNNPKQINSNERVKANISGFTLLEVMIVMAIIAILATIAIPSKMGRITQTKVVESIELVEPYKTNIELYFKTHSGEFPDDNDEAGIPKPKLIKGNYLNKMEVRGGAMHLWFGQKLPEHLHNKIITIRPVFVKDSPNSPISWVCGQSAVPDGMIGAGLNLTDIDLLFLPGRCR